MTAVEFTFLDSLDPASVAGFSPDVNLELVGVSLDPLHPPHFNTSAIGLVRPYQVLTVPLANPLPTGGPYHVRLVSSASGNLLRTLGATQAFSGTYDVDFEVASHLGPPPVVSRVSVSSGSNVSSLTTLDPTTILAGSAHLPVPPHGRIEIDFSRKMRSPVPVLIAPAVPVPTTVSFQGETLTFHVPTTGLSFNEAVQADPATGENYTALVSAPTSRLDLGASYQVTIPSDTSLAIQSTFAQDENGLALVPNISLPGNLPPVDFTVTLDVSGVLITSPEDGSYLNASKLSAPSIEVRGVALAGDIPSQVSVFRSGAGAGTIVGTADTGPAGTSSSGAALEGWSATVPTTAFDLPSGAPADGTYFITAGDILSAFDIIEVFADRSAPQVGGASPESTLDLFADADSILPHACFDILPSPDVDVPGPNDAVKAKLYFRNSFVGPLLGVSDDPTLAPPPAAPGTVEFCFDDIALPVNALVALENPLVLVVSDAAGNATRATFNLRIHAVVDAIAPSVAFPGDTVRLEGRGLIGGVVAAPIDPGGIVFNGSVVPLLHSANLDGSAGPIRLSVTGDPGSLSTEDVVTIRVPDFAASGPLALETGGLRSRALPLTICNDAPLAPLTSSFDASTVDTTTPNGFPLGAFVGDIGLTGILRDPAPPTAGPDLTRAGVPILFAADRDRNLDAWTLDAASGVWSETTIASGAADQRGFSAAQGPDGDVRVAWLARDASGWQPYISARALAGGNVTWNAIVVGPPHPATTSLLDPAIALAYAPDGRAGLAYVAPISDSSSEEGLWVALETAKGSGAFSRALVDGPGIGSVSTAFDEEGRLWIAYAVRHVLPFTNASAEAGLRTARVEKTIFGLQVLDPTELAIGLAPSIAVDPSTDLPSVAYLPALPQNLPVQEAPVFRTWTGSSWTPPQPIVLEPDEAIAVPTPVGPAPDPSATPTPVPFPQSENANVLVAKTALRFAPDGTARFAYARPSSGGVFLATRQPDGSWVRDLIETAGSPGPTFAMTLSGDSARIGYFDRRAAALRFYDEDQDRKLLATAPPTACASNRYRSHAFTLSKDRFVDAHDDLVFTTATLANIANLPQTDLFVTALTRDTTILRAVNGANKQGDHEDFILVPAPAAVPSPTGTVLPVLRFEYSSIPNSSGPPDPSTGFGPTRARVRMAVLTGGTSKAFVELATDDTNANNLANSCHCPIGQPCCHDAVGDPLTCDLSKMDCTSPASPSFGLPTNIGQDLRNLADTLPLVPPRQDASGGPVTATLSKIDLTMDGLDVSASGSELTAGVVDLDLPAKTFEATAHVTGVTVFAGCVPIPLTGRCVDGTDLDLDLADVCGGGSFDVGVSKPNDGFRLRIEGPPTAVQRNGSARFGMPILAGPEAFAAVSGDLDVDLSELDPCLDDIYAGAIVLGAPGIVLVSRSELEHEIKAKVSDTVNGRLRHPTGQLLKTFVRLAQRMNPVLASPLLESDLIEAPAFGLPIDGRDAVVLKVDSDGRLRAVFEKGFHP